ncbi:hypothetical protein N7495_000063 [Penicillium taxi]|uniref:uncharacterized protein n=1 Tax=Penicillium taxi TaxID=168475 RepID=UPI0025458154|nr:uncharacterized protein N7495_000063 [Penicillium taxi]KAJ5907381.1 hypothetical protein N7495_000063 [Penicillium taxi]
MSESTEPSRERRGHRLAPLQTNFSRPTAAQLTSTQLKTHTQRPRPSEHMSNGAGDPVPLQNTAVQRQSSKNGLRSLFGRDKSARALTADNKLSEIKEKEGERKRQDSVPTDLTSLSPSVISPRTTETPNSRSSPATPRQRATLKTSRPKPEDDKAHEQLGWKPPPLFQAYPQSTMHACLSTPEMSVESILRLHATTRRGDEGSICQEETKKREHKDRKHLRTLSGIMSKVDWSNKVYVLATAGFILQYAGEGKNDRIPEKMLQLGPQSVAFVSDAIPGKHWVVQVSQNSSAEAGPAPAEPLKPRTRRFGFHRSYARRLARNILLVFGDPDSMISWLMAIRAEIEARGGPKLTMEKHSEEPEPQLRQSSNVRQIVKKDPHRISSLFLQPVHLRSPDGDEDGQPSSEASWMKRNSYVSVHRSTMDSRSESVSTVQTDPNGSDANTSYQISATTAVTEEQISRELDRLYTRSPPSSSHGKRQSLYGSPLSEVPAAMGQLNQANVPDESARCASPPAPNFSVPLFSKKFVAKGASSTMQDARPSVDGVLRGESIASPPQSPTYSAASSRRTESTEPVARDSAGRRILRTSNSEDVLSRTVRAAQNAPNFSRISRGSVPNIETGGASSRPLSLVGQLGLGIQIGNEAHHPTLLPSEPNSRTRVSTLNDHEVHQQSVPRRKSMPGLVIGPPAAPPPNCPLPKIPSPIIEQMPSPSISSSSPVIDLPTPTSQSSQKSPSLKSPTLRFYQSQQTIDQINASTPGSKSASRTSRFIR